MFQIPGTFPKGPLVNHLKRVGLWAVKLPSADATVVRRTQSCLAEDSRGLPGVSESTERIERREAFWSTIKPARFGMNITSNSLLGVVRFITFGKFIALFGKTRIGRWLLLNFPSVFNLGFFRKKGPTEDEVASATFKKWFVGQGFSDGSLVSQGNRKLDMEIITRVIGPEIAYLTTPIILVQSALIFAQGTRQSSKRRCFPSWDCVWPDRPPRQASRECNIF